MSDYRINHRPLTSSIKIIRPLIGHWTVSRCERNVYIPVYNIANEEVPTQLIKLTPYGYP